MAFGLAVEGEEGPFAGGAVVETATCGPDEAASAVVSRLHEAGVERSVVVNEQQVVLGLVGLQALQEAGDDVIEASVMAVIPSTVRPSVALSSLAGADEAVLVTDSAGRLLGVVEPGSASGSTGGREEDASSAEEAGMDALQGEFLDIVHAAEEHFGGRDPSEEEMQSFLHQRLVAEGRSPEDADAYLQAMDHDP